MGVSASSGYAEQDVLVRVHEEERIVAAVPTASSTWAGSTKLPRRASRIIAVEKLVDDGYEVSSDDNDDDDDDDDDDDPGEYESDDYDDDKPGLESASAGGTMAMHDFDFMARDERLPELLEALSIRPAPSASVAEVVSQLLPHCGPASQHFPRVDSFVMRLVSEHLEQRQTQAQQQQETETEEKCIWESTVVDGRGNTILHVACACTSFRLAQLLLRDVGVSAAAVNARTGASALHLAVAEKRRPLRNDALRLVEVLLRKGAPVNAVDANGRTSLHLAAIAGDAATVGLLLLYGADASVADKAGRTAVEYATAAGNSECASMLRANSDWVECRDPATGRVFWQNQLTEERTVERPGHVRASFANVVQAVQVSGAQTTAGTRRKTLFGRLTDNDDSDVTVSDGEGVTVGSPNLKLWRELAWREGIRKASKRRRMRALRALREHQDKARARALGVGGPTAAEDAAQPALGESDSDFSPSEPEVSQLQRELEAAAGERVAAAEKLQALEERLESEGAERARIAEALQEAKQRATVAEAETAEAQERVSLMQKETSDAQQADSVVAMQLQAELKQLEGAMRQKVQENERLCQDFLTERRMRRQVHNQHMDLLGAIRVFCRIRPLSASEGAADGNGIENGSGDGDGASVVAGRDGTGAEVCLVPSKPGTSFRFDACLGPDSSQRDVFEMVDPLIRSSVDGYNVTVFAYGQTGSGKTHTMLGSAADPGIAPRCAHSLFRLLQAEKKQWAVKCYGLELYNNTLVDLLREEAPANFKAAPKLHVKKDRNGSVEVENVTLREARSAEDLLEAMATMQKRRKVATTKMNSASSRSHFVFTVLLETADTALHATNQGKLTLVDLAGSERVDQSGVEGAQLKEAVAINQSLSALGDVISALTAKAKFVPYRNNLLTMLMQDCLGGNSKSLMLVNVSPASASVNESVNSMQYASRVKKIENSTVKNVETDEIKQLRKQLKQLQAHTLQGS